MSKFERRRIAAAVLFAAAVAVVANGGPALPAQEPNPMSQQVPPDDNKVTKESEGVYLYRVKVVQRDLDAVNYLHRSASTKIAFKGTPLLPLAKGEAKVESERGGITVDARFEGVTPANGFGREYLTYVLWAITPDGRPNNLGEVLPAGTKNNITVTTALQSFGLIVTAEPYFSVTQPSDLVILENQIIEDKTNGVLEKVNAHYMLLPRGAYAETEGSKSVMNPITRDEKFPLELYQANNADCAAGRGGEVRKGHLRRGDAGFEERNRHSVEQEAGREDGNYVCATGGAAVRGCEAGDTAQAGGGAAERRRPGSTECRGAGTAVCTAGRAGQGSTSPGGCGTGTR
jgi:hypothetical protein